MKCTIENVKRIELKNNRFGSRVEGFIPVNTAMFPDEVMHWIYTYEGIKVAPYANGLFVASWAETVCSERDEFNQLTGACIAESKAKAKMYRFIRNLSEKMTSYHEKLSEYWQDASLKYSHCVEHETAHVMELGKRA